MGTRFDASKGSSFHDHEFTELIYFSSGNGTYVCGNEEFPFNAHMLLVIPPHVPHAEFTDTSFSNIYFLTNIEPPTKPIVYSDHINHEMETLFAQLRYHYFNRSENSADIFSLIVELIFELIKAKNPVDDTDIFVDKATAMIFDNFSDSCFDINRIYDDVPLSKVYFASLFKKATGMSPVEYLNFVRIENSKSMLLSRAVSTKCTVNEIAEISGFDDIAYFSRVFKKYTGASPLNWLKEQKI